MFSHHATLLVSANVSVTMAQVAESYADMAEVVPLITPSLTIDDVRRLITLAYQTPGDKALRVLVVAVESINHEAQHALLKVLEEPPATTRFVLIMPSTAGLLPTVLSRLITEERHEASFVSATFERFLHASVKDRLEQLTDIAKRKAETEYSDLYTGLVAYTRAGQVAVTSLPSVERALRYLRQKGAAKKMVWEDIALSLPVVAR